MIFWCAEKASDNNTLSWAAAEGRPINTGKQANPPGAAQATHQIVSEKVWLDAEAEKEAGCLEGRHRERGFQALSERSCSESAGGRQQCWERNWLIVVSDILSSLPLVTWCSGRATRTSPCSTLMASQIGHTGSDDHAPAFWCFVSYLYFERSFVHIVSLKFDLLLY